jgi:hypothetical protein
MRRPATTGLRSSIDAPERKEESRYSAKPRQGMLELVGKTYADSLAGASRPRILPVADSG